MPIKSKLDSVPNQIKHDLEISLPITVDEGGNIILNIYDELKTFSFYLDIKEHPDFFNAFSNVKQLIVNLKFVVFNPVHVQSFFNYILKENRGAFN